MNTRRRIPDNTMAGGGGARLERRPAGRKLRQRTPARMNGGPRRARRFLPTDGGERGRGRNGSHTRRRRRVAARGPHAASGLPWRRRRFFAAAAARGARITDRRNPNREPGRHRRKPRPGRPRRPRQADRVYLTRRRIPCAAARRAATPGLPGPTSRPRAATHGASGRRPNGRRGDRTAPRRPTRIDATGPAGFPGADAPPARRAGLPLPPARPPGLRQRRGEKTRRGGDQRVIR